MTVYYRMGRAIKTFTSAHYPLPTTNRRSFIRVDRSGIEFSVMPASPEADMPTDWIYSRNKQHIRKCEVCDNDSALYHMMQAHVTFTDKRDGYSVQQITSSIIERVNQIHPPVARARME